MIPRIINLHPTTKKESSKSSSNDGGYHEDSQETSCCWEKVLMDHFADQNWNLIRNILKSPQQRARIGRHKDELNTPALALALGFMPPLDIIQQIYQTNPASIFETDDFGASVLHFACINGTSYTCIDYILSQTGVNERELATKLDRDKRCALHHAVEYACLGREDALHARSYLNTSNEERESYLNVIRRVIRAAPEMLNQYDKEYGTPIDMVQLIKVHTSTVSQEYQRLDEIYQVMRRASTTLYRKWKRVWETKGHNTRIPSQ
jgi:hypothetical protein